MAVSLLGLPRDVLALCIIDRRRPRSTPPPHYVDVRNAVRVCRAFRDAVPEMAALIADCRAAQAQAIRNASKALGATMAFSPTTIDVALCHGALLLHVPAACVTRSHAERRIVWFELRRRLFGRLPTSSSRSSSNMSREQRATWWIACGRTSFGA